jgi:hypothetical protein
MKKIYLPIAFIALFALGFGSAMILKSQNKPAAPLVNIYTQQKNALPNLRFTSSVDSTQKVYSISVSGELDFAGERVPLEDPDVKERLERELQLNIYWHSNTLLAFKTANRFFGEIETTLKANGVPDDFKFLALIESGLRNDVSPSGAVGFWQILKPTGKELGLEINDEVDERYHFDKSTAAACKYFNDAKAKLGNWTIAAASYNLGVGGMQQRVKDQQTNNYYEMFYNPETSRYVFRILAMKVIFSNIQRCGFYVHENDLYQPYNFTTVEVDTPIASIASFAAQYNLKYKHIKILNPWLRDAGLVNKGRKKYSIKIMQGS